MATHRCLLLLLSLGATLLLGAAQTSSPAPPPSAFVRHMVDAHNRERLKHGLLPLRASTLLVEAALAHARDMAQHEKMAHEGSDGSHPDERIRRTGYQPQSSGENVAMGYRTLEDTMDGWMHSPGHRRNILGDFREMGAARVRGADGQPYWAVVFGRPFPTLVPREQTKDVAAVVNALRRQAGVPALAPSPILNRVAQALADSLAKDPNAAFNDLAKASYERVSSDGYRYRSILLRVGTGYDSAEAFVTGIAATSDRAQSILGDFADIGVGVAKDSTGVPRWALFLARPQ